ncbi:beta-galactosidase [Hydrogenispora ethanolica]|uniref:Beta-galactosidase n=1 Tax=Hydrogenispora ethanolica TaxID=1082276 RepID=A0A4R1QQW4_HYDET|nr:glycoside hydrolase family 2 TIM barrel-domain containing protein [Hydrogenispora ethanolica]TCL56168.1 beta-galactosidase [Hydrogenispora ethanolica]
MRKVIPLNNHWYYQPRYERGMERQSGLEGFTAVNLPHANVELPYNYLDEQAYQIQSCYRYPLTIPAAGRGKPIYLHFEGVMAYAKVYLNGAFLGEHKGGYTPFDIRIDGAYDFERADNLLTVVVDSAELEDIPPFGGQIDYLTYGGIYREVSLGIYDGVSIRNLKVEPERVLEEAKTVRVKVFLRHDGTVRGNGQFKVTLRELAGPTVWSGSFEAAISAETAAYEFSINGLRDIKLWDIDRPQRYEIDVELTLGEYSDAYSDRFGFRQAEFRTDGFYLNGRHLKLRGLNRHQSYPYVGYAMPQRVQEKDARILKHELHLNLVRTSHYPQSRHFLNECDAIGLLVFEEIPGWQHIGGPAWQEIVRENVREMIERDWNHPAIILWGVRINESRDDDPLYAATNRIAHQLDATRQTGGVRCITHSHLLEDVYTFNDFIHDGIRPPLRGQEEVTGLDHKVPYLVTEFNGHMYPTKRFDQEERQSEHALRHLRVQNAAGLDPSIAGAIGWCAFDYNTHKDFGAGDRICYHGVMDMFRLPKFAAYAYKSQVAPEVEPVLEPVTFWARGERDQCNIFPLVIFTNCDYIEMQFGSETVAEKIYPRKADYPGVPYPPAVVDLTVIPQEKLGEWGMVWRDGIFRGYHQGRVVIERKLSKAPVPAELAVAADDLQLDAAQKDATRITVRVLDQYGNLLPFLDDIIKLELSGPARLQGPAEVVVKGGALAFWIETVNEAGLIEVTVRSQTLGAKTVRITVA